MKKITFTSPTHKQTHSTHKQTYHFEIINHDRKLKLDPILLDFKSQYSQRYSVPDDHNINCTDVRLAIKEHPSYKPAILLLTKEYDPSEKEVEFLLYG